MGPSADLSVWQEVRGEPAAGVSVHPQPVEDEAGRRPEASPELLFSQLTSLVLGVPLPGTFPLLLLVPSGRAGRQGQRLRGLQVSLAVGRVLAVPGESLRPYCARGYEALVTLKAFPLSPSSQGALKKDERLVAQTEGDGWGFRVGKVLVLSVRAARHVFSSHRSLPPSLFLSFFTQTGQTSSSLSREPLTPILSFHTIPHFPPASILGDQHPPLHLPCYCQSLPALRTCSLLQRSANPPKCRVNHPGY